MTHFLDYSMTGIGKIRDKGEIPVVLYFDLCDLKKYNSRYGLKAGDDQIRLLSVLRAIILWSIQKTARLKRD